MAHIKFLDETCRDGQQSLWGMRMQAGQAYPAPVVDLAAGRARALAAYGSRNA